MSQLRDQEKSSEYIGRAARRLALALRQIASCVPQERRSIESVHGKRDDHS